MVSYGRVSCFRHRKWSLYSPYSFVGVLSPGLTTCNLTNLFTDLRRHQFGSRLREIPPYLMALLTGFTRKKYSPVQPPCGGPRIQRKSPSFHSTKQPSMNSLSLFTTLQMTLRQSCHTLITLLWNTQNQATTTPWLLFEFSNWTDTWPAYVVRKTWMLL